MTQEQAAAMHDVKPWVYQDWEHGNYRDDPVFPRVTPLGLHENCLIRRRREGLTQSEVAALLGISRQWVNLMETNKRPVNVLATFWSNR